jgi:hypothetical protein
MNSMKNNLIYLVIAITLSLSAFAAPTAIITSLIGTMPQQLYPGCYVSYGQNPDDVIADTVMTFLRDSVTLSSFGPTWGKRDDMTGVGLNNGLGISIGSTTASQYKYLLVEAQQGTVNPFNVVFSYVATDAATKPTKTNNIVSTTTPVANKWLTYIFDLSTATNTNKTYYSVKLIPEMISQSMTSKQSTTLINRIWFSNSTANLPPLPTNITDLKTIFNMIVIDRTITFKNMTGNVEVYNTLGKMVLRRKVDNNAVSLADGGIYIVKFVDSIGMHVQKVFLK